MNKLTQTCAAIALALVFAPTAFADPPANKGKDNGNNNGNGNGNGANHGQVVSECAHRANQRNLKGQERKEWTEWCEDRGGKYNYDYNRYGSERNCYQKADNKGLSGDKRRKFINDCLDRPNKN